MNIYDRLYVELIKTHCHCCNLWRSLWHTFNNMFIYDH